MAGGERVERARCVAAKWSGRSQLQKGGCVSQSGFDEAVEAFRIALESLLHGDATPVKRLWSLREDVTVANPFGPPRRGPEQVQRAIEEAAANYSGGSRRFEEVSRFSTPDLGYVVQLEHTEAKLSGEETAAPFTLRVTMIFRREDLGWKVAHRHADTVTTARTIDTVITS
jgi:ketosteroid isomerase-like protein